jgi:UDP-N-acetylmuramoyl-L-alanyl-D-glutamate--2,6-diaminopimelate ligase
VDAVAYATHAMKLALLFRDFPTPSLFNPEEEACGITCDSREVSNGFVFVCIKGNKTDGHRYISQAHAKGAIAFVVEDPGKVPGGLSYLQVDSAKEAYSLLCQRWTYEVWKKLQLFAVTGTTGKTTIAYILHQTLMNLGIKSALIGTAGYYLGNQRLDMTIKGPVTTPEPKALHTLFQDFFAEDCKAVSMEASSFGLSEKRLYGMQFDAAILSNLAFNHHIGFHGGWMDYVKAKSSLFAILKQDGLAILNADEKHLDLFLNPKQKTILYGFSDTAHLRISDLAESLDGISFSMRYHDTTYRMFSSLQGAFQAWNLAAVFALGLGMKYDPQELLNAMEKIKAIPGRWDLLLEEAPFTVVIDKANTPIAIQALSSLTKNKRYVRRIGVFGNVGGGDYAERVILAKMLGELFDQLILTLDDPEDEDIWNNFNEFLSGMTSETRQKVRIVLSRKEAMEKALDEARSGDLLLILGRGNQREFLIRGRSEIFDDVEEMKALLKHRGLKQ